MQNALNNDVPVRVAALVYMLFANLILGAAKRHLEKGRVVIFAAGTGNPFFIRIPPRWCV